MNGHRSRKVHAEARALLCDLAGATGPRSRALQDTKVETDAGTFTAGPRRLARMMRRTGLRGAEAVLEYLRRVHINLGRRP